MSTDQKASSKGGLVSAMFLVGGTCIGGGMLALPVITGPAGFIPSLLLMIVCWMAMTLSALLLLEVSLWMAEGAHVISMASAILGRFGKAVAWVLYLFICYASIVAYTAGGGAQLATAVHSVAGFAVSKPIACSIFLVVFGMTIYLGSHLLGRVNAVLFVAMIGAYVLLVGLGVDHVETSLLTHRRWSPVLLAVPFLLTAFSFQTMVPSLTPYLKRNSGHLRWAIIGGTTIALSVYIVWQWLVLGIIPLEGSNGLLVALQKGEPATIYLRHQTGHGNLALVAEYFAFFSLVTSFLGTILGLFDFLSDGLRIPKVGLGRVALALIIGVPTLFFAIYFERAFIVALDTSGGYGDSILNGIMPALMVWIGRYRLGYQGAFRVPGGKVLLGAVVVFFTLALALTITIHAGWAGEYLGIKVPDDMLHYKAEPKAVEMMHELNSSP